MGSPYILFMPISAPIFPEKVILRPPGNGVIDDIPREPEEYTPDEAEALGFYHVEDILKHKYQQGWKFLTKWENFPVSSATWEPPKSFLLTDGTVNRIFRRYCEEHDLQDVLRRLLKSPLPSAFS